MWEIGNQKVKKYEDFNAICKDLTGDLDEIEAKITLAKFLKTNIGFCFEMLCGVRLLPIQEIVLKGLLLRDNSLVCAGRGWSKSTLISILSILYPIFHPESKGCLISMNFRGSRRILEASEKMVNSKKAAMLQQCFPNALKRANDMYSWKLENGSEIFALPLSNGDGLRGTRSSWVAVDEGLGVSFEIQTNIIRPFLTNKQNLQQEMDIREIEDELIKNNAIKEEDRISFPKNKYMIFSSACYEFEYLYTVFCDYIDKTIKPPDEKTPPTYFCMRASYESLPENSILDMTQINSAKASGGENSEYFKREYRCLFSKNSDGFFNVKRLIECTVKAGDYPTVQLKGDSNSQYILSIDPAYSQSKNSDNFGFGLYLLVPQERKMILVHTYGKAGGELKEHFEYFTYLLTFFNIVFCIIDGSGTEFIHGYNESTISKEKSIKIQFLDCDFDTDEYVQEIQKAKNQYNLTFRKIIYAQKFTSGSIRKMNDFLQNQIEARKVWFASPLEANEVEFKKAISIQLPFKFKNKFDQDFALIDYIADQDNWITETKNQTALIEVKATVLGVLQYDLPQNLRRSTDVNRARKDNYTCLLLACWGMKLYFDIMFAEEKPKTTTFTPILIR